MNSLLTTQEAMDYLKISYRKLWDLLKDPNFPAFKIGSNWRIEQDKLKDYFNQKNEGN